MDKIIKVYKEVMTGVGIIGLVGFIASVLIQVVSRTFLPTAPNWTEEAARYLFIYMVAFAGNAAVLNDEYVGVEMLVEKFPNSVRKAISMVIMVCLCVFSGFVFINCVVGPKGLLAVTPPAMVSTALTIPMKYIYAAEIFLFGCYVVSFIMRIYMILSKKKEG
ncbi:MAG: TRAP transporter small permease [Lachnospiraceae bacterium]|nr:TRAP transporter small permease [Lachnospiraceae bacterium]